MHIFFAPVYFLFDLQDMQVKMMWNEISFLLFL
jgi:hypothetical protein